LTFAEKHTVRYTLFEIDGRSCIMSALKERISDSIGKVRKFLEDFYFISDRPNCLKMTEQDFREALRSVKNPPKEREKDG